MAETAQQLINSALKGIGALAKGETPSAEDSADALKSLQYMLENWNATGTRIWFVTTEDLAYAANPSTIGSGATLNTARPESVLAAYLGDIPLEIVDYAKWLRLVAADGEGYLFYSPEYPYGKIYVNGTGTLKLSSLKPLTDPADVASSVSFPPEYNDAIKWNLMVRLAPDYGKQVSDVMVNLAVSTLRAIENKNFGDRITVARPEIIRLTSGYNIEAGG